MKFNLRIEAKFDWLKLRSDVGMCSAAYIASFSQAAYFRVNPTIKFAAASMKFKLATRYMFAWLFEYISEQSNYL